MQEHLITIYALTRGDTGVKSLFKEVASTEPHIHIEKSRKPKPSKDAICRDKKVLWLTLVKKQGAKAARENGGASLYTWLYRHCNQWLLRINKRYKRPIPIVNNRVNWGKRDIETVKKLISIRNSSEGELTCPLQSSNWYFSQLNRGTSTSRQLRKLPLTSEFLIRYAETTSEYQIRRLALAISNARSQEIRRWQLLRNAGLSDQRATALTKSFLHQLELLGIVSRTKRDIQL